jgi:hypothetical protein
MSVDRVGRALPAGGGPSSQLAQSHSLIASSWPARLKSRAQSAVHGLDAHALSAEAGRDVPSSNVLAIPMACTVVAGLSASAADDLATTTSCGKSRRLRSFYGGLFEDGSDEAVDHLDALLGGADSAAAKVVEL